MTTAAQLLLTALLSAPGAPAADIPAHPRDLAYPDFVFTPPERAQYRHVLPSAAIAYVVEDHDLPLADVSLTIRTGSYLEPPGKEGLADLTGGQMRAGGTARQSPEDFDEDLAFLAANVTSSINDTEGSATLNCLSKDLDRGLDLFFDMVRTPRFDAKRLALKLDQEKQDLARRNDQTQAIESREWERLIRGESFFSVDRRTQASVEGITRDDLAAFHRRSYHPKAFIFAVSGDVKTAEILEKLETRLKDWGKEPYEAPPPIPKPDHGVAPGTYVVDKPSVNQGRVSLGHLAVMRDDPDYHALWVMNEVLGGGGFTSRIMSRVRSDEGLAYSAGSRYDFGVHFDGIFRAYFQSKSESVAKAIDIVLAELRRIREEKVSKEELDTAIQHGVGSFPRTFATAQAIAGQLASDELTGRAQDFWRVYREKLRAVTADDVQRVARKWLHPDGLVILVVGNAADIEKGGLKTDGLKRIPLPDPLTLKYPAQ